MAPRGAEGKYEVSIGSAWANVNNRSHSNSPHMHPGVQLSGVYYVDDGGDRDGGLRLIDPAPAPETETEPVSVHDLDPDPDFNPYPSPSSNPNLSLTRRAAADRPAAASKHGAGACALDARYGRARTRCGAAWPLRYLPRVAAALHCGPHGGPAAPLRRLRC